LLIDAALHGAGLAIVMEDMVAPFIADGRLVQVLKDWSPPFSGYHLYYPNRRHPSPAFAALLEELRANSPISRANIRHCGYGHPAEPVAKPSRNGR
jgi:DNA-binding transcriptional LysR family regulator